MSSFYNKSVKDTFKELESSEKGLTSQQAQERLEKYGENKLQEGKKTNIVTRFFKQFTDIMVIILLVAAVISLVVAVIEKPVKTEKNEKKASEKKEKKQEKVINPKKR